MTTCRRPGCHRKATKGHNGYCKPHTYSTGTTPPRTPTHIPRQHLQHCLDHGDTITNISQQTGIPTQTLRTIKSTNPNVTTKTTPTPTTQKILNHQPQLQPTGRPLAWPYQRRIRALRAAGHTTHTLTTHSTLHPQHITNLTNKTTQRITGKQATQVTNLWNQLNHQPTHPPTHHAPHTALPYEWDNIDNPHERHRGAPYETPHTPTPQHNIR